MPQIYNKNIMTSNIKHFSINKFLVSCVNLETAVSYIKDCIDNQTFGYICASNARSAYQSNHEPDYCLIQNNSLLTVPDGRPLVWIAHNLGHKEVGQVSGDDIFHAILKESKENNFSHYFYGSSPDTIKSMRQKLEIEYPEVIIKDMVSPPFQPLEEYDIEALAKEINDKAPTFLWVGLGAPKQERLMDLLQPKLNSTICIGVGLVFEYFAGNVKRAPKWARKFGLEWLIRDLQQWRKRNPPRRVVFSWTINQILKSFFKKAI